MKKPRETTNNQLAEAARVVETSFDNATGRHPIDIFHAICRTTVRPIVELAIFDVTKREVLLTKRSDDDAYFPGEWHLPGVVVVPTDIENGGFDQAAIRAIDELEGTRITPLHRLTPRWISPEPRQSARGGEAVLVYGGLLIDEEPEVGGMFPVGNLPEPVFEHHPSLIQQAREAMYVAPAIDCRPYIV